MHGFHEVKQNHFEKDKKKWWACAPCSLLFSLRWFGRMVTVQELMSRIKCVSPLRRLKLDGMSTHEIQKVLFQFNIISQLRWFEIDESNSFIESLKFFTSNGPVLVFPPNHVVAVIKVENGKVHYMDPDILNKLISVVSIEKFKEYCFEPEGLSSVLYMFPNN